MKKSFRYVVLILAVVLMATVFVGCSDSKDGNTDKLTIGVSGEYFPFCFTEKDELQGFEIDAWNEIGKRLGKEVSFQVSDFTGLFGMLDTEKIDSIGHGIAMNDERAEKYLFSEPYLYSDFNVVTLKESELTALEDFVGKKIGVVMGGEGERKLTALCEELDLDVKVEGYEGTAAMDEDVQLGRIEARLGPKIQTAATIAKNDLNLKITDITVFTETDAYPFPKGEKFEALRDDVNKVLAEMKADGTLSELSVKWFSIDATGN